MKHFAVNLAIATLSLASAHAYEASVPAFFVLDEHNGAEFDMQAWQRATEALKGEDLVRTYPLGRDDAALRKAQEEATKAKAEDNVILLMTTTTQDKISTEFQESLAKLEQQLQTNPAFEGSSSIDRCRWVDCHQVFELAGKSLRRVGSLSVPIVTPRQSQADPHPAAA